MMKEGLTLIIPVSKDIRLQRCLDCLPAWVKVVIVLNNDPSAEVIAIALANSRCKTVKLCQSPCNLATTCNAGIALAETEWVMFTDPDCVISEALLLEVVQSFEGYDVVKARVSFASKSWSSRLVANVRYLHHHVFRDGTSLYAPGLAFRTSICSKIGGYFFDERISWGEDGELSSRILASGLVIRYLDQTVCHDSESMTHDLGGAIRIGAGEWQFDQSNNIAWSTRLRKDLMAVFDQRGRFRQALAKFGFATALYFVVWKCMVKIGYYQAWCLGRGP